VEGMSNFKIKKALKSKKDWGVAFVFGSIPSCLLQALIYNLTLVPLGWYTVEWALGEGWLLTFIADCVANFPWVLILFKALSGFIKRSPLYVEKWY